MSKSDGLTDVEIKEILTRFKIVAVIGMSNSPSKPGHYVPKFLIDHGYTIVPVNPTTDKILGLKSYKNIIDIPENVEIAEIFRRSEYTPIHAEEAVKKGVKVFWMQKGIYNSETVKILKKAKITTVWNRCMMIEYSRLFNVKPQIPLGNL